MGVKFISGSDHYDKVISKVASVRRPLWIGTADIKDVREDFNKYPILYTGLERMLCPRVHFKMLIFDFETAYIGSANLTGAAIRMNWLLIIIGGL